MDWFAVVSLAVGGGGAGALVSAFLKKRWDEERESRDSLAKQVDRRESAHETSRLEFLPDALKAIGFLERMVGGMATDLMDVRLPDLPQGEVAENLSHVHLVLLRIEHGHATADVRLAAGQLRKDFIAQYDIAKDYYEDFDISQTWADRLAQVIKLMQLPPIAEDLGARVERWKVRDQTVTTDP